MSSSKPRDPAVAAIEQVLPGTQCRRCGYDGCAPYAAAIAVNNESLDLCPPGGEAVRAQLARLTGRRLVPPDPVHAGESPRRALIVEADCIGCTKCIEACPTDAIVGAGGVMHTVVSQWCCDCDRCAPVCPVDCIEMVPLARHASAMSRADIQRRVDMRRDRLSRPRLRDEGGALVDIGNLAPAELQSDIAAALARRRGSQ